MQSQPFFGVDIIGKIVIGTEVEVLSVENEFYKIRFLGQLGYVECRYIRDPELDALAKKVKKENRYQDLSKKFGSTLASRIINGQVWIGMTSEMARLSKGIPKDINRTQFAWGVHEQWIYGSIPNQIYLYFEDGKLTTIQD